MCACRVLLNNVAEGLRIPGELIAWLTELLIVTRLIPARSDHSVRWPNWPKPGLATGEYSATKLTFEAAP